MADVYVLFREGKSVTFKTEDMTVDKIGRVFMVNRDRLYLTDPTNVALLPMPDGSFDISALSPNCHYEVCGESETESQSQPTPNPTPHRSSFYRTASTVAAVGTGAVGFVVLAPVALGAAGFTSAGIAAGSLAAQMMSAAAIANGGGVAAGSMVAVLQSAGAAGLSGAASAALATAGGAVGWLTSRFFPKD